MKRRKKVKNSTKLPTGVGYWKMVRHGDVVKASKPTGDGIRWKVMDAVR